MHSGDAHRRSARPPGTIRSGCRASMRSQTCRAPGWLAEWVSMARGQWLTAVRSTDAGSIPSVSHAIRRPVLVPPPPQNRSTATNFLLTFAIPLIPPFDRLLLRFAGHAGIDMAAIGLAMHKPFRGRATVPRLYHRFHSAERAWFWFVILRHTFSSKTGGATGRNPTGKGNERPSNTVSGGCCSFTPSSSPDRVSATNAAAAPP